MTRILIHNVPEKPTSNRDAPASSHGRPSRLPRFVDHPELKGRWAYEELFAEPLESPSCNSRAERELRRFKRMHFCGRRMKTLRERYGAGAMRRGEYGRFARLYQQLRDDIAADNLGLVYSLYKQSRIVNVDADELLSEGMMALTRAMDTFNPWLGFCFSTYACNAIVRAFYRCGLKESKRRQKEPVTFESALEKSDWLDTRRTEESSLYVERLARILSEGAGDLTGIERSILAQRFPLRLGVQRHTLVRIGRKMNLSKERVRQIEQAALEKLHAALERDPVLNPKSPAVRSRLAGVPPENAVLLDAAPSLAGDQA